MANCAQPAKNVRLAIHLAGWTAYKLAPHEVADCETVAEDISFPQPAFAAKMDSQMRDGQLASAFTLLGRMVYT